MNKINIKVRKKEHINKKRLNEQMKERTTEQTNEGKEKNK